MTVLYRDEHVTLDERAIEIHRYYFPFGGSRTIAYPDIETVQKKTLSWLALERIRLWGGGLRGHWFHLDLGRPFKEHFIAIAARGSGDAGITPDDPDSVLSILRARVGARP